VKIFILAFILTSCFSKATLEELQGPDIDNNGVRDDIDEFIDSIDDRNDEYKQALRDYAYFGRESFKYDDNKEESRKNSYRMAWAYECISLQNDELYDPEILPKIQEYNQVDRAARKKLDVEWKKVKLTEDRSDDKLVVEKSHKILGAINEKYKTVLREKEELFKRYHYINDSISKLLTNTSSRKKSFRLHDQHFGGSMVISSRDKKRVCGFRKRGYL